MHFPIFLIVEAIHLLCWDVVYLSLPPLTARNQFQPHQDYPTKTTGIPALVTILSLIILPSRVILLSLIILLTWKFTIDSAHPKLVIPQQSHQNSPASVKSVIAALGTPTLSFSLPQSPLGSKTKSTFRGSRQDRRKEKIIKDSRHSHGY